MIFNLLFIPGPYLVGMLALLILPTLANPEMAVFEVAAAVLPSFAVGIVMAAIMAAIMSTADALLLQAGTIMSQDIYARFINRKMNDKQMVMVSRIIVLVLAVVGFSIAAFDPPSVAKIVIFSTTVLGSAFVPAYVCAVWWKKANTVGAISSMLLGTISSVAWELAGLSGSTGIDPMVIGIVCSTLAMIIGSLLTQRSNPVPAYLITAMQETAKLGPIPAKLLLGQDHTIAAQAQAMVSRKAVK